MYGSVDANLLRFIKYSLQLYEVKSICTRQDCPKRERTVRTADVDVDLE